LKRILVVTFSFYLSLSLSLSSLALALLSSILTIPLCAGCYFADCQVTDNPNPLYRNEEIADDLWKLSEELVKQKWDDLPID